MLHLGLARGHDRGRSQGKGRQDERQRGDQAFERGNHEQVLRVLRGTRTVDSRGEGRALID
jgi:hypothetical protein